VQRIRKAKAQAQQKLLQAQQAVNQQQAIAQALQQPAIKREQT